MHSGRHSAIEGNDIPLLHKYSTETKSLELVLKLMTSNP
jgi:hypothetical protein